MKIEVHQLPPTAYSPNWRGHWASRYSVGKTYQEAVYYELVNERNLTGQKTFRKVLLDLTFIFATGRDRDENNLRARFKPGQDALVLAELIPEDTPEYLVMGKIEILVDKTRAPLTIIELKEILDD